MDVDHRRPEDRLNTTVNVVWEPYVPDRRNRGVWDQAIVERLLGGRWQPPGWPTFTHHDTIGTVPAGRGAVVVVPARHHAGEVDALNAMLAPLPWVLLILTGDEEHVFPAGDVRHPNLRLWVQTPDPARTYPPGTRWLPNGPAPLAYDTPWGERTRDVVLLAQDTHSRRHECADAVQAIFDSGRTGHLTRSAGFTQGVEPAEYMALMASARVCPAPSGPVCADSFRAWEALELGTVPVLDAYTPSSSGWPYWSAIGAVGGKSPAFLPSAGNWADDLPVAVDLVVSAWPVRASRATAWWMRYQRDMACNLVTDLRDLMGDRFWPGEEVSLLPGATFSDGDSEVPSLFGTADRVVINGGPAEDGDYAVTPVDDGRLGLNRSGLLGGAARSGFVSPRFLRSDPVPPDDLITVLMPTSPIPSHPSTRVIEETIDSVRAQLPRAEILVMCDGPNPTVEGYRQAYEEYLYELARLCREKWTNVLPVIHGQHLHQSGMTRHALDALVATPTVLFCEHDTPLGGRIDWPALTASVTSGQAGIVRLHHEARILECHEHLMLGPVQDVAGAPLRPTQQFSARPHLADTDLYRRALTDHFGGKRCMVEDVLHSVVQVDTSRGRWDRWRLHVYHPADDGHGIRRSWNTDGRQGDDKWIGEIR